MSSTSEFLAPNCHPLLTEADRLEQKQQQQQQLQAPPPHMERLKDVLTVLRRQEAKYFTSSRQLSVKLMEVLSPNWRSIMMTWMYSVVDIFQLVPQVVPTAIYYMDQAMEQLMEDSVSHQSHAYQLIGMASLQLAIKVHDTKLFPLDELVRMGQAGFKCEDVIIMEQRLVEALQWNLHPPTPHCFVHAYAELLAPSGAQSSTDWATPSPKDVVVNKALELVRKALLSEVTQPPSVIAYASMLVAMEHVQYNGTTLLSTKAKQEFCWNMLQYCGMSATTPGLAHAYQALAPKLPNSTPQAATPAAQPRPVSPSPTEEELSESTSNESSQSSEGPLEEEASTIIYSAGDELGFEVFLCGSSEEEDEDDCFSDVNLEQSDELFVKQGGWSPRNVSGAISPARV